MKSFDFNLRTPKDVKLQSFLIFPSFNPIIMRSNLRKSNQKFDFLTEKKNNKIKNFSHFTAHKLKPFRFLFPLDSSENHQIIVRLHFWSVQNQYHFAAHEERCVDFDVRKVGHEKVSTFRRKKRLFCVSFSPKKKPLFYCLSTLNSSMEVLTSNSTYFSISEPKAKLMTRYSREMTLINSDSSDLTKKKVTRAFIFFDYFFSFPFVIQMSVPSTSQ